MQFYLFDFTCDKNFNSNYLVKVGWFYFYNNLSLSLCLCFCDVVVDFRLFTYLEMLLNHALKTQS